jgi:hypothetical protein
MLRTAPRSSKFFHIAKSPNDQTKLRDIVSNPHDMPISNKSIDEMIKEVLPDNSEDSSDNQGIYVYIISETLILLTDIWQI